MKRCFSIALILALLGTTVLSPALAEEMLIVAGDVEASVAEAIQLGGEDAASEGATDAQEQTLADIAGESPSDIAGPSFDSNEPLSNPEEAVDEVPTSLQLNRSSVTIGIGEDYKKLAVVALPEGTSVPEVTWRSGKTSVAVVNAKTGVVTGVRKGKATIYAKVAGVKEEIKCKVTVKAKPNKITLKPTALNLGEGVTAQLSASLPRGTASGALTYKSSNKSVAIVDETGLVTALSAGTATITVSTYNKKKAKCKVTVQPAPASVAFPDTELSIAVGQTLSVNAKALAADGSETAASFTYTVEACSPDMECVSLDPVTGALTGLRKGQAVISATTHNGVVASCVADVDVGPAAVLLNSSAITIGAKEIYLDLLAELVVPDGAASCAQSVSWSSSNSSVAKVDPTTGMITGVKKGSCTVMVQTPNGKSATCAVKVCNAPTSKTFSVSPSVGALDVGQSGKYTITWKSGCGGSLSFESSDPSIATVDASGIVTAVAPGAIKITVTTYNGVKKVVELVVNGDDPSGGESGSKSGDNEKIDYLLKIARSKLDAPYRYGSFGPNAFDCSGFAYWCYRQINITLKDSAKKQGYDSTYKQISYSNLKPGDLVFFNTVEDSDLSDHTGIYLGNKKFIHASSSAQKVIISSLASGYYKRNFSWGRRILN